MNAKVLLAVSAALNVLLVVALCLPPRPKASPGVASTPVSRPLIQTSLAGSHPEATNVLGAPPQGFDWRNVESTDYKQYLANLRAIGCPEETIRDIIVADVNKLFAARRREMRAASANKLEFWKTGANALGSLPREKQFAQNQRLAKEKRELLKALLGDHYTDQPDLTGVLNPLEEYFGFLPASKQGEALELEQKYALRARKLAQEAQNGDHSVILELRREKDAELAKLLTPQEFEDYQLRLSQTANYMRMRMSEFQPTEQEFRDIFKLQKQFDDQYGIAGLQSKKPAEVQARTAAQKQLDGEIRNVLGEDRFLDYKYGQNLTTSSLNKIAEEYQIPRQQALKVFDLQAAAQEQAQSVRANNNFSPEQRQQALDALRAETEKEVGNLIPRPALDAYIQRGSWFKNLNRPRSIAPAP